MFVCCAVSTFAKNRHSCATVQLLALIGQLNAATVAHQSIVLLSMALPVMEFQDQGYKIKKIFA